MDFSDDLLSKSIPSITFNNNFTAKEIPLKEGVCNFLTKPKVKFYFFFKILFEMVDKSTCVQTKAFQNDENLFNLKQGSTATINITILCKVGGKIFFN